MSQFGLAASAGQRGRAACVGDNRHGHAVAHGYLYPRTDEYAVPNTHTEASGPIGRV